MMRSGLRWSLRSATTSLKPIRKTAFRSLFSTEATDSANNARNALMLAPVVLSGLVATGIVFHLAGGVKSLKGDAAGEGKVESAIRTPTNSADIASAITIGGLKPLSGSSTPKDLNANGISIDTSPRTIWTVGEKVDKKQFKERYEEIYSDKKGMHMVGRGAYGRVLSAVTKGANGGQKVAMKVVSPNQMSAQALSREVEVLRRVRGHDNIIHLLEVLEFNGSWYLVTELCEGGDLLDRLITDGPYDEPTCASVIYNVASALDHVHRCGFVHFDVKPENLVFVTKGGTRGDPNASDVRLIDFGMAKDITSIEKQGGLLLRSSSSVVEQMKSNPKIQPPRVGTIAYWSPEQIVAGNATMDKNKTETPLKSDPRACDAWALGVIMYIMLFGCHPFDIKGEGDERRIAYNILNTPARLDVHGDRVVLSKDARDVLLKLLEPDPSKRIKLSEVMNHPFFADVRLAKSGGGGGGIDQFSGSASLNSSLSSSALSDRGTMKLTRKRTLERLPTSWKKSGFTPTRTPADDAIDDPVNTFRFAPFKTLEASQAIVQALLLAAVATAEEEEDEYRSSESLYRAAFDALDTESRGVVTARDINQFAQVLKQGKAESGDALASAMERAASRLPAPTPEDVEKIDEPHITFEEFQALLRSNLCVSRTFEKGETVFEQGALPQGVYLLVSGQAKVEWHPSSTSRKSSSVQDEKIAQIEAGFAVIPPGSIIGETAIVQGRLQRSATIRITEKSQVIYIPKQEFLLAVASSKALNEKIMALTNEQQARRVFQFVDKLKQGREVKFHQGQVIFKQGEPANSLYLVRNGVVELAVRGQSSNKEGAEQIRVRVGRRRQGDVVGVSAIHPHGKRSTSATCLTDVEAVEIDSEDLLTLLENFPILRFYVESQKRWRNENWQKMLADVEKGVSEPQILPMLGEGVEEDSGKSFEEYQKALAKADIREYRAGEYVFRRGERSGELFVVESGRCDVEIRNEQGQIMTITQLGPGDHIGEQALLDGRPQYAFTVRCVTPVVLRALSEKQFFHLLGDRGHSTFARAVRVAMRQRRHLWVAKLLNLAHEDNVKTQLIGLNPDETLFKIGEPIDRLYFVHRGSFVVTRPDGTVVRTMAAGETIGWEVFKEGGATSTATATCLSKAVVEALPKEALDGMIARHRYVSKELEHAASTIVPEFSGSNLVRRRSLHQPSSSSSLNHHSSSSASSASSKVGQQRQ